MGNQLDRKQEIKEETKKFKTMSFSEKLTYIKDYYWLPIVAVILTVIVGLALVKTFQQKNFKTVLYIALINNEKSVWSEDVDQYEHDLSDVFAAKIGIDNEKQRIIVDNSYTINMKKDSEMSLYSAESLIGMYQGQKVDLMLGDQEAIEYFYGEYDTFFHDLNDVFDEEFLQQYQDKIVYFTGKDGNKTPVAFDVSECQLIKDSALTIEPAYLAIYYTTKRLDVAADYVRFVLTGQ